MVRSAIDRRLTDAPPHRLAFCGLVAPSILVVSVAVAGALRPGYDPISQSISTLGFGPNAIIVNAGLLAYGLLNLAFAIGLHRGLTGGTGSILGPTLVGVGSAAAAALALEWAILSVVMGGRPLPASTEELAAQLPTAYDVHVGLALTSYVSATLASVALAWRLKADVAWRGYALSSQVVGIASTLLLLYVVFGATVQSPSPIYSWFGGAQRLLIGLLSVWLGTLALRLLRLGE